MLKQNKKSAIHSLFSNTIGNPRPLNKLDSLRVLTDVLVLFIRDAKKKKKIRQKEQNIELIRTLQTNSVTGLEATKVAPVNMLPNSFSNATVLCLLS